MLMLFNNFNLVPCLVDDFGDVDDDGDDESDDDTEELSFGLLPAAM